jgi:hypothetical protein
MHPLAACAKLSANMNTKKRDLSQILSRSLPSKIRIEFSKSHHL